MKSARCANCLSTCHKITNCVITLIKSKKTLVYDLNNWLVINFNDKKRKRQSKLIENYHPIRLLVFLSLNPIVEYLITSDEKKIYNHSGGIYLPIQTSDYLIIRQEDLVNQLSSSIDLTDYKRRTKLSNLPDHLSDYLFYEHQIFTYLSNHLSSFLTNSKSIDSITPNNFNSYLSVRLTQGLNDYHGFNNAIAIIIAPIDWLTNRITNYTCNHSDNQLDIADCLIYLPISLIKSGSLSDISTYLFNQSILLHELKLKSFKIKLKYHIEQLLDDSMRNVLIDCMTSYCAFKNNQIVDSHTVSIHKDCKITKIDNEKMNMIDSQLDSRLDCNLQSRIDGEIKSRSDFNIFKPSQLSIDQFGILISLYTYHDMTCIDLPGGQRSLAETPLECAIRETYEEIGLDLNSFHQSIDSNDSKDTLKRKWLLLHELNDYSDGINSYVFIKT